MKTKVEPLEAERLLNKNINWELVIKQSFFYDILPLLYCTIDKFKTSIPQIIFATLKNFYYLTLTRNIYLWKEFCYIQDLLHQVGIKVIPLKGIILIKTLYYNIGLRSMEDIDILVQEKDLVFAKRQLLRMGYQKYLQNLPEDYWKKYHCHFSFRNPNKNIILDIHWALAPSRPDKIDINEIWQRAEIQKIEDSKVLVLSREDILLSLCLHICKNISNLQHPKLKELYDIHELISQYGKRLDWDYVINKIILWKLKGCFFYLYILSKTHLSTPWPTTIIPKVKISPLRSIVLNAFISNIERRSRLVASLLMLVMLDSNQGRFRLVMQRIAMVFRKMTL